ncbi:MAG: hypothetical protein KME05_02110 [Gloeocapsa sp. UFS-A4-WI-NPMV-4B04]|jgi:hypothetical protein|nr:hypothetical protein [Gloeocapsa sp. UFS-A4-WI-NPMV-4B04]
MTAITPVHKFLTAPSTTKFSSTVYHVGALASINGIKLIKVLPLVLELLITGYYFAVCVELLSAQLTGFIRALLMNWEH